MCPGLAEVRVFADYGTGGHNLFFLLANNIYQFFQKLGFLLIMELVGIIVFSY